jgi:hypothetical protein
MLLSWQILSTGFTKWQIIGACLIIFGALLSSITSLLPSSDGSSSHFSSMLPIVFYASSNLPYAASAVYKERAFKNTNQDVLYMTQQVSIYQVRPTAEASERSEGAGVRGGATLTWKLSGARERLRVLVANERLANERRPSPATERGNGGG